MAVVRMIGPMGGVCGTARRRWGRIGEGGRLVRVWVWRCTQALLQRHPPAGAR